MKYIYIHTYALHHHIFLYLLTSYFVWIFENEMSLCRLSSWGQSVLHRRARTHINHQSFSFTAAETHRKQKVLKNSCTVWCCIHRVLNESIDTCSALWHCSVKTNQVLLNKSLCTHKETNNGSNRRWIRETVKEEKYFCPAGPHQLVRHFVRLYYFNYAT